MKVLSKRWSPLAAVLAIVAVAAVVGSQAVADSNPVPTSAKGLGPLTGLLPRDHLTEESAIQVDLSKEIGAPSAVQGQGERRDGLVRAARRLRRRASRTTWASTTRPSSATSESAAPECVQTVTLESPTPAENTFGQAVVDFQGAPDFSPTRIAEPGPDGFPLANFQPGAVAGPGYSPFIRIAGSQTRLQRADRRHRRRPLRRRPPHQHRRPRARHPHRRAVGARASTPSRGSTCCS